MFVSLVSFESLESVFVTTMRWKISMHHKFCGSSSSSTTEAEPHRLAASVLKCRQHPSGNNWVQVKLHIDPGTKKDWLDLDRQEAQLCPSVPFLYIFVMKDNLIRSQVFTTVLSPNELHLEWRLSSGKSMSWIPTNPADLDDIKQTSQAPKVPNISIRGPEAATCCSGRPWKTRTEPRSDWTRLKFVSLFY